MTRWLIRAALLLGGCHQDVVLIPDRGPPPDCMVCLDAEDCAPAADGALCSTGVCQGGACVDTSCEEGGTFDAVAAGDEHSCALSWTGTVWCWGRNDRGQLALGDLDPRPDATSVGGGPFAGLAAGAKLTALIARDRAGVAAGDNGEGQLGVGDVTTGEPDPRPLAGDHAWRAIDGGQVHACGVTEEGGLLCWGKNADGQLGVAAPSSASPAVVDGSDALTWAGVSAGGRHSCAVDLGRGLYCWGGNGEGQLGVGDTAPRPAPARVMEEVAWTQVSAGASHTCAIDAEDRLWCWGSGREGQLGVTEKPDRADDPLPVELDLGVLAVTAGDAFTCAIALDRSLWCWGKNREGQLGLGDQAGRDLPERVGAASDWAAVAAGKRHVCAVRTSGALTCWGDNREGQLGLGNLESTGEPHETCTGVVE